MFVCLSRIPLRIGTEVRSGNLCARKRRQAARQQAARWPATIQATDRRRALSSLTQKLADQSRRRVVAHCRVASARNRYQRHKRQRVARLAELASRHTARRRRQSASFAVLRDSTRTERSAAESFETLGDELSRRASQSSTLATPSSGVAWLASLPSGRNERTSEPRRRPHSSNVAMCLACVALPLRGGLKVCSRAKACRAGRQMRVKSCRYSRRRRRRRLRRRRARRRRRAYVELLAS